MSSRLSRFWTEFGGSRQDICNSVDAQTANNRHDWDIAVHRCLLGGYSLHLISHVFLASHCPLAKSFLRAAIHPGHLLHRARAITHVRLPSRKWTQSCFVISPVGKPSGCPSTSPYLVAALNPQAASADAPDRAATNNIRRLLTRLQEPAQLLEHLLARGQACQPRYVSLPGPTTATIGSPFRSVAYHLGPGNITLRERAPVPPVTLPPLHLSCKAWPRFMVIGYLYPTRRLPSPPTLAW